MDSVWVVKKHLATTGNIERVCGIVQDEEDIQKMVNEWTDNPSDHPLFRSSADTWGDYTNDPNYFFTAERFVIKRRFKPLLNNTMHEQMQTYLNYIDQKERQNR